MNTYARQKRDGGAPNGGGRLVKTDGGAAASHLGDERPQVVAQLALAEEQNDSPEVLSLARQRRMLDASPRVAAQAKLAATMSGFDAASESAQALQRQTEVEEEEVSAASGGGVTQRQTGEGEEEGLGGGLLATTKGVATGLLSGAPTGDVGVDLIVKLIRSQVSVPEWRTAVEKGLALLDQKYIVPTASGWFWSKTPDLLKSLVPLGANFVSGLTLLRAAFHVLPAPVQTLILYFVASRLRKFLSLLEGSYLKGEQIDSVIEWLFVDDPVSALEKVYGWVSGLVKSPLAFLFNYFTGGGPTGVETPTDEGGADVPATGEGGEDGGPEQAIERRAESGLDTLFALDLDVVKLDVGKPRLRKRERKTTPPVERSGGETTPQGEQQRGGEETGTEAGLEETLMPGGLSLPFNFSISLFGREFSADQTNELIMPWAGGLYLNVPRAVLNVNAGVEGVFQLRSIVIEPLVVTQKGLESLGLYLEGLDFAGNVVQVEQVGGRWSRGKGALFRGDVTVEAMSHKFAGRLILQLDKAGSFQFANVVIMSPDAFDIVPGTLRLTSPKFSGSIKKGTGISLAFGGNLGLAVEGVKLSTDELVVAYNGGGGGFGVSADSIALDVGGLALTILKPRYDGRARALHADLASLRFGKASEEPQRESDWLKTQTTEKEFDWLDLLKVAPSIEWAIPDIWIRQDSPHLKMGKPRVAVISLNAFGLKAGLDFNKRTGSLDGALGYKSKIPVVSLPIPILPGLEAFVDLDVFAGVDGSLAGSLTKGEQDESPWHVEGKAGLGGHVGANLSAGVQVGSQLLAALAVGLFAEGRGDINADAGIRGGVLLKQSRIMPVANDPMRAEYAFAAAITAKAGLIVKAKVLHVIQRTLYQRTFKQWDMGRYNVGGVADWTGEGWKSVKAAGSFEGGKPTDPAADDRPITAAEEARELLLEAGRAIAGGAELRRELVLKVVDEYKRKDLQVYGQLDEASQTLAAAVSEHFRLKSRFLGSIRYGDELKELETKIPEYRKIVEGLKSQYLEILTVLVNVEKAISTVADSKLTLGTVDLTALLRQVYATAARMEDAELRWAQVKPEVGSVGQKLKDEE